MMFSHDQSVADMTRVTGVHFLFNFFLALNTVAADGHPGHHALNIWCGGKGRMA